MIFNSVTYLVFLTAATILYWVLPNRARLYMLFMASVTFYGFWRWDFVPVMLFSAMVDYFVSLAMQKKQEHRKILLSISLLTNLGLLFYFKYLLFFVENSWSVLNYLGFSQSPPVLNIILPLGISFYTFQTISYSIDVYRRQTQAISDFVLYGCYVMFFPQLVAGPILRAGEVIPQLQERPQFCSENIAVGMKRILVGLFLKVVLADNIAPLVDEGFAIEATQLSAIDVWTLAFLFGFQIYFDFSAYSHIALGSARLMGIVFPENFRFPYSATSPKDFWSRWHISLSSWIRDYLYLPLMGARVASSGTQGGLEKVVDGTASLPLGKQTKNMNQLSPSNAQRTKALFLTWAIMGFWHGANWTFVLWGVYHAACIFGYRCLRPFVKEMPSTWRQVLGWFITLPVMMLGWIPFRAIDLQQAFIMLRKIFYPQAYFSLGMRENTYLVALVLLVAVVSAEFIDRQIYQPLKKIPSFCFILETALLTVVTVLVFVFLRPITLFIYFQF